MLMSMRPHSDVRADGKLRDPQRVAARIARATAARSRQTNGKRRFDKRSSRARRILDLMGDYLRDFPEPDEAALGLARAAAIASVRIEDYEEKEVNGETVDDELFVRVAGQLNRSLAALRAMKPKSPAGEQHHSSDLARHLEKMAERKKARLAAEALATEGAAATD
jgi:hypothetical protein